LQIDIFREYECAQSSEWLAGEEVGFTTLDCGQLLSLHFKLELELELELALHSHILKILKKVGDGFSLTVGQYWFIQSIARFAYLNSASTI
jgi:hypothetical protein